MIYIITIKSYLPDSHSRSILALSRSSILHTISTLAVAVKFLLVDKNWYVYVKGSVEKRQLFSSLLLQQYPPWLVRLTWMVLKMGDKCSRTCYFVGGCFRNFFNICRNFLVQFLSSFFFYMCFVSVHVVHPLFITGITGALKTFNFILSDRSNFH